MWVPITCPLQILEMNTCVLGLPGEQDTKSPSQAGFHLDTEVRVLIKQTPHGILLFKKKKKDSLSPLRLRTSSLQLV